MPRTGDDDPQHLWDATRGRERIANAWRNILQIGQCVEPSQQGFVSHTHVAVNNSVSTTKQQASEHPVRETGSESVGIAYRVPGVPKISGIEIVAVTVDANRRIDKAAAEAVVITGNHEARVGEPASSKQFGATAIQAECGSSTTAKEEAKRHRQVHPANRKGPLQSSQFNGFRIPCSHVWFGTHQEDWI